MKKRLVVILVAVASAVFLVLLLVDFGVIGEPHRDKLAGVVAPRLMLSTLEDEKQIVDLTNEFEKITVVTIWSSWCTQCEKYNRELYEIRNKYDIRLVGIVHKDNREKAAQWIQSTSNPFVQNLFDPNGYFSRNYEIYGLPESVIVDERGVMRKSIYADVARSVDEYMKSRYGSNGLR